MKKTIIISVALALLLSGATAYASEKNGKDKDGDRDNDHKTVVVAASTTAQIQTVKEQIQALKKQLAELKRTNHIAGQTVESDDNDSDHGNNANTLKACKKFLKEHKHWKWGNHGHRQVGW